jgi:hypothetical protein
MLTEVRKPTVVEKPTVVARKVTEILGCPVAPIWPAARKSPERRPESRSSGSPQVAALPLPAQATVRRSPVEVRPRERAASHFPQSVPVVVIRKQREAGRTHKARAGSRAVHRIREVAGSRKALPAPPPRLRCRAFHTREMAGSREVRRIRQEAVGIPIAAWVRARVLTRVPAKLPVLADLLVLVRVRRAGPTIRPCRPGPGRWVLRPRNTSPRAGETDPVASLESRRSLEI